MILALANNQTRVAVDGTPALITTDPFPLGDNNYGDSTLKAHVLFSAVGTPAVTLAFQLEGSNDGGNTWFAIPGLDSTRNQPGQADARGQITCAQIRGRFTLSVVGNPGDWGVATFDCHINLKRI